jgi:hypothetical protein
VEWGVRADGERNRIDCVEGCFFLLEVINFGCWAPGGGCLPVVLVRVLPLVRLSSAFRPPLVGCWVGVFVLAPRPPLTVRWTGVFVLG